MLPDSAASMCRRVLGNLVLLTATLATLLLAGEVAARLALRHLTTTADFTSYLARRWRAAAVRLNRAGFRERELSAAAAPGHYRIAVVGDSFAYGQGVAEDERFSNLLERRLNAGGGHRYEVLNFGRPGAETVDEVEMLRADVLPARPDFVLLQWFVNDVEGHDKRGRPRPIPLLPFAPARYLLQRTSALYFLASSEWYRLQTRAGFFEGWGPAYAAYMRRRFADPASPDSRAAERALSELVELVQGREHPLVGIVLFPDLGTDLAEGYPFAYLHDRVLELCERRGIPCLDLRPALAPHSGPRLWVNALDPHPGALAHRLAAERLLAVFGPAWQRGATAGVLGLEMVRGRRTR